MKVSEIYILDIRTFICNYCMLNYNWKETLTHKVMSEFLLQKKKYVHRMSFSSVNNELVLKGECIFVKDEIGQVIPYKNPLRCFNISELKQDSSELRQIRERLLFEQGFRYNDLDEVVLSENNGRQIVKIGGNSNDKY